MTATIEVSDRGLDSSLAALIKDPMASQLLIACPFITSEGANAIVDKINERPRNAARMRLLVITKFELLDFICGASEVRAIQRLFDLAQEECKTRLISSDVYDLPSLHAKLFLTNRQAIVGSANLTHSALYGGNAEICLSICEPEVRRGLKAVFVRLVDKSSAVNRDFLAQIERQLQELKAEQQSYEKLREKLHVYQAASKLCRLPIQGSALEQADYYGQMVVYLKWIEQGNSGKTQKGLRNKIAKTLSGQGQNNKRLAWLRVEFLKAIGVIRFPSQQKVCLTPFGEKVVSDPKGKRKAVFNRILKWCEVEHHDHCLRDLMRPFGELQRSSHYLTIRDLQERAGDVGSYDTFTTGTSPARNWLQSLGVIQRDENTRPYRYKRGTQFPAPKGQGSIDGRLNAIVGIEDSLVWLREGE